MELVSELEHGELNWQLGEVVQNLVDEEITALIELVLQGVVTQLDMGMCYDALS